jgi:photosynthetic reaction center H subunit
MSTTGAITQYIDVAQITLYAFWIFFAGLIIYLLRENKREGYPLDSDRTDRAPRVPVQGFPAAPGDKTYRTAHGDVVVGNGRPDRRPIAAEPTHNYPGAPLEPTGNPMLDGVGPAAWAERADVPDMLLSGEPKIVPLRTAAGWALDSRDPDPRGMDVIGGDGASGGTVVDVWVDRAEPQIRYLEVETAGARRVLVPMPLVRFDAGRRQAKVKSIFGAHFADVPRTANPDRVTMLEEEKVVAYFAGGTLYASPDRLGPLL